jgi:hypothetical protein
MADPRQRSEFFLDIPDELVDLLPDFACFRDHRPLIDDPPP